LSLAAARDRHFRADKPLSAYAEAAQANGANPGRQNSQIHKRQVCGTATLRKAKAKIPAFSLDAHFNRHSHLQLTLPKLSGH
jgi:hypothetical protein